MKYPQLFLLPFAALSWTVVMTPEAQASVSTLVKSDIQKTESKLTSAGANYSIPRSPAVNISQTLGTEGSSSHSTTVADTEAISLETESASTPVTSEGIPVTPVGAVNLEAAAAAVTPVTDADTLTVVELVEPGTGNAWLPAQSASALTNGDMNLAQAAPVRQSTSGWYVALAPEVVFGYDIDLDGDDVTIPVVPAPGLPPIGTATVPVDVSIDTDTGFGINGAVGYRFDNVRAEFEVGYNNNSVDSITVNDVDTSVDGDIGNWKFLINGYYDFPTNSRFSPYLGGGIGVAILSANDVSATVPNLGEVDIDDSSASFLFQFKAGAGYDITETLNAFLGYRLMGIPGQSFEVLDADLDADTLFIHSLQLGVRYEF
ncbi:MAG: porin family protein [Leptolyngbya sp. SIOISBB]|nr:porin family protein [Leptolyngbya sp. SIOISBB]